ncbi:hypothetical protein BJ508DRAFT_233090, partial [Ascobolus immersus RN42]
MSSFEHSSYASSIPPIGTSRIRPPSKIGVGLPLPPQSSNPPPPTPTPSNDTLNDMSSSQSNARSMMPPPPKPVAADRRTLVQRAADGKTPAPGTRGTSATPGLTRQRSISSLSNRTAGGTYSSTTSGIGRASSIKRPGSAAGNRPGSAAGSRPASAQSMRSPVDEVYIDGYEEPVIPRKKRQAYDTKGHLEDAENEIAQLRRLLRERYLESTKKDETLQQLKKESDEARYRGM